LSEITGWSLHCSVQAPIKQVNIPSGLSRLMVLGEGIPRGGGQSFGDVSLPDQGSAFVLKSMPTLANFVLNEKTGVLVCPASGTQKQVLDRITPAGWILPVVPGASGITIGGAVAADAHGKNHYTQGSIVDHLVSLKLALPSGDIILANRDDNSDIFWATIGGVGLTGLILEATLQLRRLRSLKVAQAVTRFESIPEMLTIIESQKDVAEFLLGTVDGNFGPKRRWRGVITSASVCRRELTDNLGRMPSRKRIGVPSFVRHVPLGALSTWALNNAIQLRTRLCSSREIDLDRFLFPQDALAHWNRLFGKSGFIDYQCCVPLENSLPYLTSLHSLLNQFSTKCFLIAIKRFRKSSNQNPLVFAQNGISIALDMPRRHNISDQLDILDELAIQFGGRVNLVKDARLSRKSFSHMYPEKEKWLSVKRRIDPDGRFRSRLSNRLGLDSR